MAYLARDFVGAVTIRAVIARRTGAAGHALETVTHGAAPEPTAGEGGPDAVAVADVRAGHALVRLGARLEGLEDGVLAVVRARHARHLGNTHMVGGCVLW